VAFTVQFSNVGEGRTQGGRFGVKPPLVFDILRKLYYLRKED